VNLLILGGPRFLGRHVIEVALARGHRVTLFNRGHTGPELYPGVEKLRGDRAVDLSPLEGRTWDAVVDTSGFLPEVVRRAIEVLRHHVGHYVFVSSISVYQDFSRIGMTEESAVATLTPEQTEILPTIDPSDPAKTPAFWPLYGALKAACERLVQVAFPGRAAIPRPGLIIGPHDYMDRFPYWVARVAEGGEVLAPGRPDRPVQVIDARDLAAWMVRLSEGGASGVFNATGPDRRLPMSEVLEACREAASIDARFTWVDEEFLVEHGVKPWEEMPLWVPEATSTDHVGILGVDVSRAVGSGLTFRSLVDTARDTLEWERGRGSHEWRAGLARDRERELLSQWNGARGVGAP
jgi:2'-hydroxyisoflavone reductase